jgi:hypothetical protein
MSEIYSPSLAIPPLNTTLSFASAGSQVVTHGLNTLSPVVQASVTGGATRWSGAPIDADTYRITASGAMVAIFTFIGGISTPVAPAIMLNPASWSGPGGGTLSFTAAASGSPAPTVQWQTDSGSGGASWTNIAGATSATFTTTAAGCNGWQYRAVFTNASGCATTSCATATITGDIASGLLNYWPMNEGTGSSFIDAIAANNLTAAGISWSGGTPTFSGASGVSGAYTTTQPAPLNNASTPFSVSMWVNLTAPDGAYLLSNSYGTTPGWQFTITGSGYPIVALVSGGFPLVVDGSSAVAAGVRQNIVFTYDGSRNASGVKIYLNGTLLASNILANALSTDISAPPVNFFVMAEPDSAGAGVSQNNVPGTMDHLRIYNRVLAAADIAILQTEKI